MSSRREFAWRPGFPSRGVKAADAHRIIESVRDEQGIDPASVVEAARPRSSPIHSLFTWDDGEAARLFRLDEAKRVIRHVVVVHGEDVEPTRAFVSVFDDEIEDAEDGRYRFHKTEEAMSDPRLSEKILRRALQDLVAWKARYAELKAASSLVSDVEAVVARHMPKARRKAS